MGQEVFLASAMRAALVTLQRHRGLAKFPLAGSLANKPMSLHLMVSEDDHTLKATVSHAVDETR